MIVFKLEKDNGYNENYQISYQHSDYSKTTEKNN